MMRRLLGDKDFLKLQNQIDDMIGRNLPDQEIYEKVAQNSFVDSVPFVALAAFLNERKFNVVIDSWLSGF